MSESFWKLRFFLWSAREQKHSLMTSVSFIFPTKCKMEMEQQSFQGAVVLLFWDSQCLMMWWCYINDYKIHKSTTSFGTWFPKKPVDFYGFWIRIQATNHLNSIQSWKRFQQKSKPYGRKIQWMSLSLVTRRIRTHPVGLNHQQGRIFLVIIIKQKTSNKFLPNK